MTRPRDRRDLSSNAPTSERLAAADLISHDMVLEGLIFSANAEGQEYGITVTVGGTVVSGILSADAEFLRFLAEEITEGQETPEAKALRADLEETATRTEAKLRQVLSRPRRGQGRPIPLMPTLHLRDATVWLPGGQSVQVPYWRGRVDAVDGWFLGIIGARPEP
jgi:hypothetical protein